MINITSLLKRNQIILVVISALLISITSTYYYNNHNLILAYGDAESHVNIAKRVVSSITPGFGQLGGNWLPLQHILMLPFVWNDNLWRSGLGGSIVSMIAYILTSIYIYKSIKLTTSGEYTSILGAALFMFSPAILYMQSTPMSELPLMFVLTAEIYYLIKWSNDNSPLSIVASGFFAFSGSLIRYDAWFLIIFTIIAISIVLIQKRFSYKKIEGIALLYSTIALLGCLLWIIWNYLVFSDPFYFITGAYSAHAQQLEFLKRGELISYHNLWYSVKLYSLTFARVCGELLSGVSIISLIFIIYTILRNFKSTYKETSTLLFFTPYLFYVLTLFLGISIILIPEMTPIDFQFRMFNIRYGLMMIPFVVIFTSLLFDKLNKVGKAVLIIVIIAQYYLFITNGPSIVVTDAINGLSARAYSERDLGYVGKYVPELLREQKKINEEFASTYDYGYVMFDDYSRPANPIDLNVPMESIIYIGNHPMWEESLINPEKTIRWIIVRENETDSMWNILKDNQNFINNFDPVYRYGQTTIYKQIDQRDGFVKVNNGKLSLNKKQYKIAGVNSYDLSYKNTEDIAETFQVLSEYGVNTVRLWVFGENRADGFQTEEGIFNDERLQRLDYVLQEAKKNDIKLILTLSNNWDDYGGKNAYEKWLSNTDGGSTINFFTNEYLIDIYKKHILSIVGRKNQLTDEYYKDDKSILAWEIMNEPRVDNISNEELSIWASKISAYIKSIDKSHLISSGTERVVDDKDQLKNNTLCEVVTIDICSIHLYLEHNGEYIFTDEGEMYDMLKLQTSKKNGKPTIIGEFGIPKDHRQFDKDSIDNMHNIIQLGFKDNFDGVLIWNWSLDADSSYGFSKLGGINGQYNLEQLASLLKEF